MSQAINNQCEFTVHILQSSFDQFGRCKQIKYKVHNTKDLVLIDDGFNFDLKYSKEGARSHAKEMMKRNSDLKFVS